MTEVYISGDAGRAVYVDGPNSYYVDYPEFQNRKPLISSSVKTVLRDACDVEYFKDETTVDTLKRLSEKTHISQALSILEISFDRRLSKSLRKEASDEFCELTQNPIVKDEIENLIYATPHKSFEEGYSASDGALSDEFIKKYWQPLLNAQDDIKEVLFRMDSSLRTVYSSPAAANAYKHAAVKTGIVKKVVLAWRNAKALSVAKFNAYKHLNSFRDNRELVNTWIVSKYGKNEKIRLVNEVDEGQVTSHHTEGGIRKHPWVVYEAVNKQRQHIIDEIKNNRIGHARRYTNALVETQIREGDHSYAAKSLSSLAMIAREYGHSDLELEFAQRAVLANDSDVIAHGTLADTYLRLFQYREAELHFNRTAELGDTVFGELGLARTKREARDLDGSLSIYKNYENRLDEIGEDQQRHFWLGYCSLLSDMWRYDEAKRNCIKALDLIIGFPEMECTYANILKDSGNLQEALEIFDSVINRYPTNASALCGRGNLLRLKGKFKRAEDDFCAALALASGDFYALLGLGNTRVDMEQHKEARALFRELSATYPSAMQPQYCIAETFRNEGNLESALDLYSRLTERNSKDLIALNGKANILKLMGQFEASLQVYDSVRKSYPFDLYSLNGRADLLKRLGKYQDSLEVYQTIIEKYPLYKRAQVSKAAILSLTARYDEALRLLSRDEPRTDDDWVGFHIQAIIKLRLGKVKEAVSDLDFGVNNVPFARLRRYFKSTLAAAYIRNERYHEAEQLVSEQSNVIEKILLAHSFAETSRMEKANDIFFSLSASNSNLAEDQILRDIVKGFPTIFETRRTSLSRSWLMESELKLILQAA